MEKKTVPCPTNVTWILVVWSDRKNESKIDLSAIAESVYKMSNHSSGKVPKKIFCQTSLAPTLKALFGRKLRMYPAGNGDISLRTFMMTLNLVKVM